MGYKRPDMVVRVGLKGQKGYTMQDIGALDKRITQLEYYTVLSALSLTTQQLSITNDNTGLVRFKNGIFADPFNDSSLMRTDDPELNIAISPKNSIARPNIFQLLNEFELDTFNSTGVQATGKLLTLDYSNELLDSNPFATEYRNCTESYWNFKGTGYIFPDFYMGIDKNNAAPQNISIDQTTPLQSLISSRGITNIDTVQGNPVLVSSRTVGTTTTNYYSETQTQTITDISITGSTTTSYTNDNIVSVASLPYMSARTLAFIATGLKPNTRIYPYFDKLAVYQYCAPATVNPAYTTTDRFDPSKTAGLASTANATDILTQNGNVGDPLYTNANGEIFVIFYLPGSTFRAGDRVFTVCDSIYLNLSSSITTEASAVYTSSTLATTTQTTTYNIIQPKFTPVVTTKSLVPLTWTTTSYAPPNNNGGTGNHTIEVGNLGGGGNGGSTVSGGGWNPTPAPQIGTVNSAVGDLVGEDMGNSINGPGPINSSTSYEPSNSCVPSSSFTSPESAAASLNASVSAPDTAQFASPESAAASDATGQLSSPESAAASASTDSSSSSSSDSNSSGSSGSSDNGGVGERGSGD
jgi:hypothetical protein